MRTNGTAGRYKGPQRGKERLDVTNNPNVHTRVSSKQMRVNKSVDGRRNVTASHRIYLDNLLAKHEKQPFLSRFLHRIFGLSVSLLNRAKRPFCRDATNTHKRPPDVIVEN